MSSHYDQIGPQFLLDFEYGESRIAASDYQFAPGFGAEIFGCDLCELSQGVLLPLRSWCFHWDFGRFKGCLLYTSRCV